jgi:predicted DNA repair protein MutK
MAGSSLLALIDDIASLLDDVSVMTKVAATKTAGVLGDDLALNAQQVAGVSADRELPVVWAVAKGSFKNKLILVPSALLISALVPWLILPLLMLGGAFLCFEGFEKLAHKFLHAKAENSEHHQALTKALSDPSVDIASYEQDKIKGAIRTDFVLSAEIVVITLGTLVGVNFTQQVMVLAGIAIIMTIGVYGLVAGIVKLDDAGLFLAQAQGDSLIAKGKRKLGQMLVSAAPYLMRTLAIIGTVAMFMVGGGIIAHAIPLIHDGIHHMLEMWGVVGYALSAARVVLDACLGVLVGALTLGLVTLLQKLKPSN